MEFTVFGHQEVINPVYFLDFCHLADLGRGYSPVGLF